MSTAPPVQIHTDSLDISGISTATSTKSLSDPRLGTIYNPGTLAAATPIYFHPLPTSQNNFVAVFSSRYTSGTISTTDPAAYTAWTLDDAPSWAQINAVTGSTIPIHGSFYIPMSTAHDSATVQGGCSVPPGYLYLINTVVKGDVTSAVLQHFFWTNGGVMRTLAEETVPSITVNDQTVLFDRGCFFDSPFVVVVGYGLTDNKVYLCRMNFGGVGNPSHPWQYRGVKGWSVDPTEATPLLLSDGETNLVTYGPCSAVTYKSRVFLSTVQGTFVSTVLTATYGTIFTPSSTNRWKPFGTPVALGAPGSSYLGGLYLQQQLGANPSSATLANQGNAAAYPYVVSQFSTDEGTSTVSTSWNLLGIPRLT